LEHSIRELPSTERVGPLLFTTDDLKNGLIRECGTWRRVYGQALNQCRAQEMNKILETFDNLSKRLSRPIKDLDDVRGQMAALAELREAEIEIDMTIGPIEESYALLNRYELYFNDGNAERVDALTYGFSKLRTQSREVQDHLLEIQPKFKLELVEGVQAFKQDVTDFVQDYDTVYVSILLVMRKLCNPKSSAHESIRSGEKFRCEH
uniref:DHC_N1 domain-containing protein n=1 Tax=Echinostoma caproni TaxID=27848 RepID=A0A183A3S7_9TREM